MKKIHLAAIAIALAVIVVGAGLYVGYVVQPSTTTQKKVILVIGSTKDVFINLDPAQSYSNPPEYTIGNNVFDPLYRVQPGVFPQINYVPWLATDEPKISADGLQWTISLRKGVKFHDGTPFNASAYKFSIDRVKQMNSYPAFLINVIDRVEVVDNYTITIVLKRPYSGIKGLLVQIVSMPVSPTAVKKMTKEQFQELPVGTGPFKYVEWIKGDHITLERFEDYWNKDALPKAFRIIYKIYGDSSTLKLALDKGEVDVAWEGIAAIDIPSVMKDPSITTTNVDYMYIHWLTLNTNLPNSPLKDVRVRRAIAYSINQDEISQKIYYNVQPPVKDSVFLPGMMMKPSWLPYTENGGSQVNLDKAKQLLAEAGYPNGIDVTLWYTPIVYGKEVPDLALLLQQQLAKVGIRVSFQVLERSAFSARFRAGEFEMALGIMSPDYPDPDAVANFIAYSGGSYSKRVRLNDTTLDQLVAQGQTEPDPAKRQEIYGKIQDRLADIMCYVPLVRIPGYIFSRAGVTGFEPFYFHFAPWWLLSKDAA